MLMLCVLAASCQKENSPEPKNYTKFETDVINLPVSVENNTLVFETEKDYQLCLDLLGKADTKQLNDFEKVLNFESLRNSDKSKELKDEDKLFLTLLNPKRSIIIANHIFTVNFDKERTYMSLYSEDNNLKSSKTLDFGWDDDVFEYLETRERTLLKRKRFCKNDKESNYTWISGQPGYDFQVKALVRFKKYSIFSSIYFSLEQTVSSYYAPIVSGNYTTVSENYYRRKSGGRVSFSRTKPNTILSPNGKIHNRPYGASSRRLKEYRANVKFNINYTYNNQYHSYYKTLLIECHG